MDIIDNNASIPINNGIIFAKVSRIELDTTQNNQQHLSSSTNGISNIKSEYIKNNISSQQQQQHINKPTVSEGLLKFDEDEESIFKHSETAPAASLMEEDLLGFSNSPTPTVSTNIKVLLMLS